MSCDLGEVTERLENELCMVFLLPVISATSSLFSVFFLIETIKYEINIQYL